MIPVVATSSREASKLERTSASIAAISFGRSEDVTGFEISITAINPVIDGIEVGKTVVGGDIGCVVGRAVT